MSTTHIVAEQPPESILRLKAVLFGLACITDIIKALRLQDDKLFDNSASLQNALMRLRLVSAATDQDAIMYEPWNDGDGSKLDEGFYVSTSTPALFLYGDFDFIRDAWCDT